MVNVKNVGVMTEKRSDLAKSLLGGRQPPRLTLNYPQLDLELYGLIHFILRDFVVNTFYQFLSQDPDFLNATVIQISKISKAFETRLGKVDWEDVLLRVLPLILRNHLHECRVIGQPSKYHPASVSAEKAEEYLRLIVMDVLDIVTPREDVTNTHTQYLLREIITCCVFAPLLEKFSTPQKLYDLAIEGFESVAQSKFEKVQRKRKRESNVWRKMSGFFQKAVGGAATVVRWGMRSFRDRARMIQSILKFQFGSWFTNYDSQEFLDLPMLELVDEMFSLSHRPESSWWASIVRTSLYPITRFFAGTYIDLGLRKAIAYLCSEKSMMFTVAYLRDEMLWPDGQLSISFDAVNSSSPIPFQSPSRHRRLAEKRPTDPSTIPNPIQPKPQDLMLLRSVLSTYGSSNFLTTLLGGENAVDDLFTTFLRVFGSSAKQNRHLWLLLVDLIVGQIFPELLKCPPRPAATSSKAVNASSSSDRNSPVKGYHYAFGKSLVEPMAKVQVTTSTTSIPLHSKQTPSMSNPPTPIAKSTTPMPYAVTTIGAAERINWSTDRLLLPSAHDLHGEPKRTASLQTMAAQSQTTMITADRHTVAPGLRQHSGRRSLERSPTANWLIRAKTVRSGKKIKSPTSASDSSNEYGYKR